MPSQGRSGWLGGAVLLAGLVLVSACGGAGDGAAKGSARRATESPSSAPTPPSLEADGPEVARRPNASAASAAPPASPAADAPEETERRGASDAVGPLVVFLGDSLTAGFGLEEDAAYPAVVAAELGRRGIAARVINAGVSGDTSAGGLARLDWLLAQRPDVVVVALGANDGLRGQPLAAIAANLRAIVERSRAAGARVVLAGMKIPPNYGPDYATGFEQLYPRLADELDCALIPFLLEGVAARPEMNLPDGIHPNGDGHRRIAELVVESLAPLVAELDARS